jgi:predicted DNA-binding transcriptional regulator AlpA
MQNHTSNFLNTTQAANFLGLKPVTLEVWRCYGKGPRFARFGRAVRYRLSDLENYITASTHQHTSESADNVSVRQAV